MTIQCFGCHSGSNAGCHKGLSATAAALLALLSGGFSSMALAAQPVPAELKLAIGAEPTEGFDPLLGWSHGSYLLLHSPLLKQNADLSWQNVLTQAVTRARMARGGLSASSRI